ncbi:hypothetical protein [Polycyclovorans algicola]|uniref:hypothetical protein n=1 Tax=Polycyclovorans algicola TaxID=616992 RepID=UPI0004A7715F|nr:hypothetical protein [Polycyclovorans algicola]
MTIGDRGRSQGQNTLGSGVDCILSSCDVIEGGRIVVIEGYECASDGVVSVTKVNPGELASLDCGGDVDEIRQ